MDNSQQQPRPTAYAHLLRHPDSGYNSPLSSPFFGRRAAAAGLSTLGFPNPALYGSVDSLVPPSFSITQAPDMTRSMSNGWMASAGLSDASCNSANSSRAASPDLSSVCSPGPMRKHRTQRSPMRGLTRACDSPGVAFCFTDTQHLTVVHRMFREPRSPSRSPMPGEMDGMDEEAISTALALTSFESAPPTPEPLTDAEMYAVPTPDSGSSLRAPSPAAPALHHHHHHHHQAHQQHQAHQAHQAPRVFKARGGNVKQCACCGVTNTPLWRDIGGAMPLCNACGIRYKKYGVVCPNCKFVPCKSQQTSKTCMRCGHGLPPPSKRVKLPSC